LKARNQLSHAGDWKIDGNERRIAEGRIVNEIRIFKKN
jgi:hypothetical protein